jgi:hypothetical protein
MPRRFAVVSLTLLAVALAPAGAAAVSPTVRLAVVHAVHGCHVWANGVASLGPSTTLRVKAGTKLQIRVNCPMDFDFVQTAGPALALGDARVHAGTIKTFVFRRRGTYKLRATNVQSSVEQGLQTLGTDNILTLTVVAA